jgi:hypothetical protein
LTAFLQLPSDGSSDLAELANKVWETQTFGTDQTFFSGQSRSERFTDLDAVTMVTDAARNGTCCFVRLPQRKSSLLEITHEFAWSLFGVLLVTAHALAQPVRHAISGIDEERQVRPP